MPESFISPAQASTVTWSPSACFVQRDRNIKAALARILEKAGRVRVTAASVVAAVTVYGKLNSAGRFVNRRETVDLNALFDRMSRDELETYAVSGTLPDWFERTVSLGGQFAQHKNSEFVE